MIIPEFVIRPFEPHGIPTLNVINNGGDVVELFGHKLLTAMHAAIKYSVNIDHTLGSSRMRTLLRAMEVHTAGTPVSNIRITLTSNGSVFLDYQWRGIPKYQLMHVGK